MCISRCHEGCEGSLSRAKTVEKDERSHGTGTRRGRLMHLSTRAPRNFSSAFSPIYYQLGAGWLCEHPPFGKGLSPTVSIIYVQTYCNMYIVRTLYVFPFIPSTFRQTSILSLPFAVTFYFAISFFSLPCIRQHEEREFSSTDILTVVCCFENNFVRNPPFLFFTFFTLFSVYSYFYSR